MLSGIFIFLGANYTIDSLIKISDKLSIGKDIIAVSAVALGTSLPELMVTINAALKGKAELAVGNVIGSNIFNVFVVIGIPGLITPLPVSEALLTHSVPTLLAASLLMFFYCARQQDHHLGRVVIYIALWLVYGNCVRLTLEVWIDLANNISTLLTT